MNTAPLVRPLARRVGSPRRQRVRGLCPVAGRRAAAVRAGRASASPARLLAAAQPHKPTNAELRLLAAGFFFLCPRFITGTYLKTKLHIIKIYNVGIITAYYPTTYAIHSTHSIPPCQTTAANCATPSLNSPSVLKITSDESL